jgi:flagellar motor protein MotB
MNQPGEEDAGEGYFASVSDLMIGILFVFLLMLTVFALNFSESVENTVPRSEYERVEKKRVALQEQNEKLRTALEEALELIGKDIDYRQRLRIELLESLEKSLRARGVQVVIDTQSGILRLAGDLLFETGESTYRSEAAETVRILADALAEILPCHAEGVTFSHCAESIPILETVLVEGHTDRQPYRHSTPSESQALNDRLSTERALTVFQTLRQSQPTLDSLLSSEGLPLLAVSGYGQRRPLPNALTDTFGDYERNRRIDIRFVLSSRTSRDLERLRATLETLLRDPA